MRYYRLKRVATTLNISTSTIIDFLNGKGFELENKPTTKISEEQLDLLAEAFAITFDKSFKDYDYSETPSICGEYSQLVFAILENDERLKAKPVFPFELIDADYLEKFSISIRQAYKVTKDKIAFFKRLIKRAILGFKLKRTFFNLKLLFLSIITPRLFHVFTSEDDNNSAAFQFLSLSIDLTKNFKEACLKLFSNKTRLSYARQEFINQTNTRLQFIQY